MKTYGFCPACDEPGIQRDASPSGYTRCKNHHRYKHHLFDAHRPQPKRQEDDNDIVDTIMAATVINAATQPALAAASAREALKEFDKTFPEATTVPKSKDKT